MAVAPAAAGFSSVFVVDAPLVLATRDELAAAPVPDEVPGVLVCLDVDAVGLVLEDRPVLPTRVEPVGDAPPVYAPVVLAGLPVPNILLTQLCSSLLKCTETWIV